MVYVGELRCEYLPVAMGVDTPRPRFGWQLIDPHHTRGCAQSAYQVQVKRMVGDQAVPLWDSGKVESDQSIHVEYDGDDLASTWDCRWRVRIWDQDDQATDWSDEARFVMGLLDPSDWVGDWIRSGEAEDHQHIWFRKTFELDEASSGAVACVCSIGYHELYVNGHRIGDAVLTPGVTNLAKRALYMTYDISHALVAGENVIAVWTGPGWARADGSYGKGVWEQSPMFRCQVHAGDAVAVQSDTTWRCETSSSENIGLWKGGGQGTYGGERIDARRHQPDWNTLHFDDSGWPNVVTGEQSIELTSALFEPDRKVRMLTPVAIEERDGDWRIDFGCNFTGWFEADLRGGTEGDVVKVHTTNRIEVSVEYDQESEYIFDASGQGTFSHRFNWMAGRWVTLVGLRQKPDIDDIRAYIVTNDRQRTGSFECSSTLLNAIYEADLRTYIANTVNAAVMDCPHRERYGYGEVALACTWGCALPHYESAAMYSKIAQDWCDVQSDDGMVNTIAPQPYKGAGGTLWSSAPLTLAWEHYRAFGDCRLLERSYPTLKRWCEYLHNAVTDDGVLMPYAQDSRFLGDWATPHGNEYGNIPEAQLFNNCVYAYNLMVMVEAAGILDHADDVKLYQQRLDDLREHAHAYFVNEETGKYCDGRQMAMLFPLYVRVTPEHLRESVFKGLRDELADKGYLDTGSPGLPIMQKFVVEDQCDPELILPQLLRTAYPSYGYFLARQESTWPEYWEVDGIKSRIHTCFTSIAGYFTKGIGGIQGSPGGYGMQELAIRPCIADALTFARTTTANLYGPITCNWKREDESIVMQVIIPPNCRATVHLPVASVEHANESGTPLGEADHVTVLNQQGENLAVAITAGRYVFQWASQTVEAQQAS
jgi:alpha-L-rhamnosidase